MQILIVRHADPDYSIDSLTPTGWHEAELLSERLKKVPAAAYYVSPLGRAKDTASLTLKKVGKEAIVCDWLREFAPKVHRPDAPEEAHVAWDWLPEDIEKNEAFFHYDSWTDHPAYEAAGVKAEYDWVCRCLDELLLKHGYRRQGKFYEAVKPNDDILIFFCHFGLECVLLSHLMNVSPVMLWHGLCAAPSSVTTVNTEERRRGKVLFRTAAFGDISHLYIAGEEPSFSARFCSCYDNAEERHD